MKINKLIKKRVFLIAEIGQNHNGDLDTALQLVDEATKAGFDAVKFQKGNTGKIYKREYRERIYRSEETYAEHRDSLELTNVEYERIIRKAYAQGLIFFASCFDFADVKFLDDHNVPCFKVASRDLTSIPLIMAMAKTGKPLIISTGMSTIEQVDAAVAAAGDDFALLQCVSSYPAPYDELNLGVMKLYQEKYGCPVGFSDHTVGCSQAAIAAVAMGAKIIEKHITLGRWQGGDHASALEAPFGTMKFVRNIRNIESALGSNKKIQPSEKAKLYLRTALDPGRFDENGSGRS